MSPDHHPRDSFQRLKAVCVPLLGAARLTPASIARVSNLLSELIVILNGLDSRSLTLPLINYTFFPLSAILQRNAPSEIPNQVLERVFIALAKLCDSWWWECDVMVWEQVFMLCAAVIGSGVEGTGTSKIRDDETQEASLQCLYALLRQRDRQESIARGLTPETGKKRIEFFRDHARTNKFIPVLGQTLHSLLGAATSKLLGLQLMSLNLIRLLVGIYAPGYLIPTVFPGIISVMTRTCFGKPDEKTWAKSEVVADALGVVQTTIVEAIGDDICVMEGVVYRVEDLEDLSRMTQQESRESESEMSMPYATRRTQSWLHGSASQLHIAINSLSPLVSHPAPLALRALANFSYVVLKNTALTLPQSQPVLLSFLLTLSNSAYESVSNEARKSLFKLLDKTSDVHTPLLQVLLQSTIENLSALPRLLSAQADSKIEHSAGMIEAVCYLAVVKDESETGLSSVSSGIGKILGPTGGIEKWGWNLLSAMELVEPVITVTHTSSAQLVLESNPETSQTIPFVELEFKNISLRSTRLSLERMFHGLGRAAGDKCLYSVEWFTTVGRSSNYTTATAALWCACRLLEGVSNVRLMSGQSIDWAKVQGSKRLERLTRGLAKSIAELWDKSDSEFTESADELGPGDGRPEVQYRKGLVSLSATLKIGQARPSKSKKKTPQPMLQKGLSLQLIALTAGILQSRFTSLFIYIMYPVLHSLVSSVSFVSSTALAALNFITFATSHASPANLLLSNFDYCLDAVSRRLTRRWLDIDAAKVLIVMVRLVGNDIVDRAADVVDECFDRLDDFHGYDVIVEGLIGVLVEIIKVIETEHVPPSHAEEPSSDPMKDNPQTLDDFLQWYKTRHDEVEVVDNEDYGPAPRRAWGKSEEGEEHVHDDAEQDNVLKESTNEDLAPSTLQVLAKQIIIRSVYFLTHGSPVIRAQILTMLSLAVQVLPDSALMPSIHSVWPFILNRFVDHETFVVSAAASLVEALSLSMGSFMFRRIWDDIWPRFKTLLGSLDDADSVSALARRNHTAVGTESAYTHSHRLYRSLLKTMTATMKGVQFHEPAVWEVIVSFRRFLDKHVHEELQQCARDLYIVVGNKNPDSVWLALTSTCKSASPVMAFLEEPRWDIGNNVGIVLQTLP